MKDGALKREDKKPLTDLTVKSAKPGERRDKNGNPVPCGNYKLRDGKGLYLFVLKSGGKSWRYDYKLKIDVDEYKNGTFVIGPYPEISLAEARNIHADTRKLVSNNVDPNEFRKEQERLQFQNKARTFGDITQEWLVKRQTEVKAKTHKDIKSRLERDVIPEIGHIPADRLDERTFIDMIKKVESRGAYEIAARVRHYCSQILKYAKAMKLVDRDFTADIGDALAVRRSNHQPALLPEEIPEFVHALKENKARLYPQTKLALKMLMLVFVRPIELVTAEWDEIHLDENRWIIPAAKMKDVNRKYHFDHMVPLATQTVEILKELKEINRPSNYVFVNQRDPKKHMSRDALSKAVRLLGFQDRHTAHGFRAMARTAIREKLNYDSEIIERQLDHELKNSLGRAYDRTQFIDQRTEMMQAWADWLEKIEKAG